MNAAMTQKTPARCPDLNPFNVRLTIDALQAPPPQVRSAARDDMRNESPDAGAEYGCVDWYQYHDPADENKITQAFRAAQAVMDQYTGGAGLKSE